MRVIPDVDVNAERSDKQKEESSKFGFLSDMLNQNLEYLKIGFPKAYQPLNYAIKKNISLVSKTENGFVFNFAKAIFSEGKLAPCSPIRNQSLFTINSASNPYSLGFRFFNDFSNYKQDARDTIICALYFADEKKLYFYKGILYRNSFNDPPRCYVRNLYSFRNRIASCSLFFYNEGNKNPFKSSNTIYFGQIRIVW